MPLLTMPSDYVSGTITLTNGLAEFTGTGTGWLVSGFREGDVLMDVAGAPEFWMVIEDITGNGAGVLTQPWAGPDLVNVTYRMRFTSDGYRSTAQAAMLREDLGNGNVQALASLTGSDGKVPMFTGAGVMTLVSRTDLVSGVSYDVQVADLAARAAYDGQFGPSPERGGFAVLVNDIGDGRSAIYSKNSPASGDWSGAAIITGPEGAISTVPGIVWRGTYSGGTAYVVNDGVTLNGSSFRNIVAGTGNAPSSASPPVDNTWWKVVAAAGANGSDGDVSFVQLLTQYGSSSLELSEDRGKVVVSGPDGNGLYDGFGTLKYVNTAGASNLDTSKAGQLAAAAAALTVSNTMVNQTFASDSLIQTNQNWRQVIAAAALSTSGGRVRFRLRGQSAQSTVFTGMTIGHKAASGDAWDMASTSTPIAVTVAGVVGFTLAAGADVWSDWIAFDLDETRDLVIAWHIGSGYMRYQNAPGTNFNYYVKTGSSEITTADVTGYTSSGNRCYTVEEIQVSPAPSSGIALVNQALGNDSLIQTNQNWRQVINPANLQASGNRIRFRLRGHTTIATDFTGMTFQHRATSGDNYDMVGTPVAITVEGHAAFTLEANANVWSDWIAFALDETKAVVIAWHLASGYLRYQSAAGANFDYYNKTGASEIATANVTGYSALNGRCYVVEEIETSGTKLSLAVESAALGLTAAPDWGFLIAFVDLLGAAINTDLIFSISRNGSAYTAVTMAQKYTRPDGSVALASGIVDITGITTGTTGKWKIATANGSDPRVLAVGASFGVN